MTESSTTPLPLEAIVLPNVPNWFPLAWGWWATLAGVLTCLLLFLLLVRGNKRRQAPKKAALMMLSGKRSLTPSEAIELVRQAALSYYPRDEIAHLTGQDWYDFLDKQVTRPIFTPYRSIWDQALYQKQPVEDANALVESCQQWVSQALPPKRKWGR